jgi:chemotaxis signal transduction protein
LIRVLDLHQILGLSSRQEEDVGKLVVLADDQQRFAVRVDAVDGIRELQQAELLPPTADPSTQLEFIDGRTADGMLVLQAEELIRAYTRGANH